jgi:glycosyltransferase involved in cell wall biosynthesis
VNRRIIALVPAFNEEDAVADTVKGIVAAVDGVEVLVVDDGSSDKTAARAAAAGAEVMAMTENLGKGGAVNEAVLRLNPDDEDILLFLDADLGSTSTEAVKLVAPMAGGQADMVIAAFGKPKKKGGFGLVKGLASWGIKRFGGIEVKSPLSGQRALKAGLWREIGGLDPGYGMETGLTIDVLRRGYKVLEVDTGMSHAETGRDIAGFSHRGRQFVAVLKVLMKRSLGRGRS